MDLICTVSLEGASFCGVRGLLVCYVAILFCKCYFMVCFDGIMSSGRFFYKLGENYLELLLNLTNVNEIIVEFCEYSFN